MSIAKGFIGMDNIRISIWCLRISTVLYALIGLGFLGFVAIMGLFLGSPGSDPTGQIVSMIFFGFLAFLCFALAVGIEFVIKGLNNEKYWAWIAAIVIFVIYCPSLYIFIAIPGLINCFNSEVMATFKK